MTLQQLKSWTKDYIRKDYFPANILKNIVSHIIAH